MDILYKDLVITASSFFISYKKYNLNSLFLLLINTLLSIFIISLVLNCLDNINFFYRNDLPNIFQKSHNYESDYIKNFSNEIEKITKKVIITINNNNILLLNDFSNYIKNNYNFFLKMNTDYDVLFKNITDQINYFNGLIFQSENFFKELKKFSSDSQFFIENNTQVINISHLFNFPFDLINSRFLFSSQNLENLINIFANKQQILFNESNELTLTLQNVSNLNLSSKVKLFTEIDEKQFNLINENINIFDNNTKNLYKLYNSNYKSNENNKIFTLKC